MCGIAGFCRSRTKHASSARSIAKQMLLDIEHRGTDATGIAYQDKKRIVLNKKNVAATEFVKKSNHMLCNYNTELVICHTRYATQGCPTDNRNNHPIRRGNITLVHNGHIDNDIKLFKQLGVKRNGQVDSEAAAAIIAYGKGSIINKLERIQGSAALAWIDNRETNTLHLARLNTSPLWLGQSRDGSFFFGSTKQTVTNAVIVAGLELDWTYEASEGEYYKVKNGVIVEQLKFTPKARPVKKLPNYSSPSKYSSKYYSNYYTSAWDIDAPEYGEYDAMKYDWESYYTNNPDKKWSNPPF